MKNRFFIKLLYLMILLLSGDSKIKSGLCPKFNTSLPNLFKAEGKMYHIPFEIYQPEYFFPLLLSTRKTFQNQITGNLFEIYMDDYVYCNLLPGLRFVQDKNKFEVVIYNLKSATTDKIDCNFEVPFDLAYISEGNLSIFWGCVQLNTSFFDEMLLVLSNSYFVFDKIDTLSEIKEILKNKTSIFEEDYIKLSSANKYENMTIKDLCNEYKCSNDSSKKCNVLFFVCSSLIIIIVAPTLVLE